MKSIKQIFKDNTSLMEEVEVKELIEYCRDLEGQVMETTQTKVYDKSHLYIQFVKEVFWGLKDLQKEQGEHDRWDFPAPNYKEALDNLFEYYEKWKKDNSITI